MTDSHFTAFELAQGRGDTPTEPRPVIVTIPDTCPPEAVGPMTDAELDAWAIAEAIRIYSPEWEKHPEFRPTTWNGGWALTNLIGDGYVVAELRPAR